MNFRKKKKKNIQQNKKAEIASEYPVMIVSIIITGLILFFIGSMISVVKTTYKTSNLQLNYEYPLIFVHSFLNMPLKNIDKKKFEKSNNINYIKDLFYLNTKKSKKLIEKYKKEYIDYLSIPVSSSQISSIQLFEYFSNYESSTILSSQLLYFNYNIKFDKLKTKNEFVNNKNNNLYYTIKTINNKYTQIYFKSEVIN